MPATPTENLSSAATVPADPADLAPAVTKARMDEGAATAAAAAGEEGADQAAPIGGEATIAATSWAGDRPAEHDAAPDK